MKKFSLVIAAGFVISLIFLMTMMLHFIGSSSGSFSILGRGIILQEGIADKVTIRFAPNDIKTFSVTKENWLAKRSTYTNVFVIEASKNGGPKEIRIFPGSYFYLGLLMLLCLLYLVLVVFSFPFLLKNWAFSSFESLIRTKGLFHPSNLRKTLQIASFMQENYEDYQFHLASCEVRERRDPHTMDMAYSLILKWKDPLSKATMEMSTPEFSLSPLPYLPKGRRLFVMESRKDGHIVVNLVAQGFPREFKSGLTSQNLEGLPPHP